MADPTGRMPPWPTEPPRFGSVVLRRFTDADAAMAVELATDPYVPATGSLPAGADQDQALAWVRRQIGRHAEGVGFSFCVADAATDRPLGQTGLWLRSAADRRARVGYALTPSVRGRGIAVDALRAVLAFAWTIAGLERVEALIEPWNVASILTAERAGFRPEGLLHDHVEIGGTRRDVVGYAAVRTPAG